MKNPENGDRQSLHILYADSDEELQKKFLKYCRDRSPALVTGVESAKEILETITSQTIDVLILGDNLPDMKTGNLLTQLRTQERTIPVILFSSSGDPAALPEADLVDLSLKKGKQPSRKFQELISLALEAAKRQQALHELSDNERRLTDIINFMPDATFVINNKGVVITWNKAIETMTGIPAEEMLGKNNYEYSLPFYGERRPIMVDNILSGNRKINNKYRVLEQQDNRIVVEAFAQALNQGKGAYLWGIASPLYDEQGNVIGAIESIRDITKRRETEDDLREHENQYRSLVEASPDMIWEITKEGIFNYISPNCAEIMGYAPEELIGRSIHELAPSESLSKHNENLKMLGLSQSLQSFAVDARHKDGHVLTLEIRSTPITDEQGRVVGMRGVTRDVTEWLRIQEEFRLSEEKNRSYIESSPAGIIVFDAELQFLDVNTKAVEMSGYTRQELLKKRVSDMVPDTLFPTFGQQREKLFETGELVGESALKRKDGTTLPIFVTVIVLPDQSYLCFVTDISELEKIRTELQEREAIYHALFDNLTDAILLLGLTPEGLPGTFIEANAAASTLLGYSHEELLHLGPQDVDAPETRDQIKKRSEILKKEGHLNFEGLGLRKDGSRVPIEGSLYTFAFSGSKMLISVIRNISKHKKIETELCESEALYHALFENITDAVLLHRFTAEGLPGQFIAVNESACRLLGYSREELLQMSAQDIEAPVSYAEAEERIQISHTNGHAIFEATFCKKDGSMFPAEISAHLFLFQKQQMVLSLAHDISKRKRFENELCESEERYSSLFYQNNSVSLLVDPDSGRIVDANTAACDYYGYSCDELKGTSLTEINGVPEEKILDNLREAKKEREKHFFSVHRLKDGSRRNVEIYSGPIVVGGKKLFYSIIHDITDKTEAENRLVQLLEERTTLLMEIHHRVNNNLQVLLSLSTLERVSFKDKLDANALANKLLSDMENRITAIALVHENLFLSGNLTEIRLVEHLRILAQSILTSVIDNVFISYEVEGGNEIVLGLDKAVLVSLVASEILTNVQKHAFANQTMGNVIIRVTEDSKNKQLLLEIADDGVGLPEDINPKTTESVGLSLIYNIITLQLHGTVTVNRDKGTTYQITLPADE